MNLATVFGIWFGIGLALAPLSYGLSFAYWQRKFPALAESGREDDIRAALVSACATFVFPPVGLLTTLIWTSCGLVYGIKFR